MSCVPGPFHETCYGIHVTPQSDHKDHCQLFVPGLHLNLWSSGQAPKQSWCKLHEQALLARCVKLLSTKKLQTTPYHPQMNGLVERSHQTIMQMIGKLGEDEKANWPGHLAEIALAYNATWSAVTGYSPHYLMFGCWPRLPVDFLFPHLKEYRGSLMRHLHQAC